MRSNRAQISMSSDCLKWRLFVVNRQHCWLYLQCLCLCTEQSAQSCLELWGDQLLPTIAGQLTEEDYCKIYDKTCRDWILCCPLNSFIKVCFCHIHLINGIWSGGGGCLTAKSLTQVQSLVSPCPLRQGTLPLTVSRWCLIKNTRNFQVIDSWQEEHLTVKF